MNNDGDFAKLVTTYPGNYGTNTYTNGQNHINHIVNIPSTSPLTHSQWTQYTYDTVSASVIPSPDPKNFLGSSEYNFAIDAFTEKHVALFRQKQAEKLAIKEALEKEKRRKAYLKLKEEFENESVA